jgi:hypothetical protein
MPKPKRMAHVPVSEIALLKRLTRKLRTEGARGQIVRKNRAVARVGGSPTWFHIDIDRNMLIKGFHDLEAFAREQEVLAPWESLAETS